MELVRALGALCEPPSLVHERLGQVLDLPGEPAQDEYADLFLFQLYPYASVYLGGEGRLGGAARDRVAGFWRALGLTPPAEPDHLASLLGLYASLAEDELAEPDGARRLLRREARRTLLHEHLLVWTDPYLDRVAELAPPYYCAWAELLRATLEAEAARLGPRAMAAALREAPRLDPPWDVGGAEFLDQLLSPVRTGFILVRSDLVAAGRELGLGIRIAERRYVLEALLDQDAQATLGWLSDVAARRAESHRSEFWKTRATASAALLREAGGLEPRSAREHPEGGACCTASDVGVRPARPQPIAAKMPV
jgi:TorA maturation chaperone TorD